VREAHDETETPAQADQPTPVAELRVPDGLGRDLVLYSIARFGIVAVVAVVLSLVGVPLVLGLAAGLILGLPVAMLLFRGWHNRVSTGLAVRAAIRREQRATLRAELRGQADSDTES
jgi:uncharacterized protein DUF4229